MSELPSFEGQIILCGMDMPHFVQPCIPNGRLGSFRLWAVVSKILETFKDADTTKDFKEISCLCQLLFGLCFSCTGRGVTCPGVRSCSREDVGGMVPAAGFLWKALEVVAAEKKLTGSEMSYFVERMNRANGSPI